MAYRNGTYVAFHAEGTPDPTASDIKYFNIMKAWHQNDDIEFRFVNSHDKVSAVRDSSRKETLRRSLADRLNNSKNFVLLVGPRTRLDVDWVPFEIKYAADNCKLPFIVVYTGYRTVLAPNALSSLWPTALRIRIEAGLVDAIHVPFQRNAIDRSIRTYNLQNKPNGSLVHWNIETHRAFGIAV